MRFPWIPVTVTRLARVGVSVGFTLLLIGLSFEKLPFGWAALLFLLALVLPFVWSRQAGSWPGLLALLALSWLPVFVLSVGTPSSAATNLLLLLMLSAMIAAPSALLLLMRQRSASAALMLLGFALFPCQFTMLLARTGAPPLDPVSTSDALLSNLAWLPGVWYPVLGMCLGTVGFLLALGFLLVREARRAV
jgi:hypothetical protein